MTKLSDDQIESQITNSHAAILAVAEVSRDPRVIDPAITRELRACFTAGKDHGEACVIERAAAGRSEHDKEAELGRAVMVLTMWTMHAAGRSWNLNQHSESRAVWLYGADGEELSKGRRFHYLEGANVFESFALAAAWCTEHARAAKAPRDTEPAPAMTEEEHAQTAAAVAGVTIDQLITATTAGDVYERMLASVAGDDAPSTERNL